MGEGRDWLFVIPALEEGSRIAGCVAQVRAEAPCARVVVADGGSSDATVELARKAGAEVKSVAAGRGRQCNAGAQGAEEEWLIFLHADTVLPPGTGAFLSRALSSPGLQIGTFRLRFDVDHWFLRWCGFFTRFDSLWTRFGDQVIVVRRTFFSSLGGFPEWPLFEDVELLRRARRRTRIVSCPWEVVTSGRKFVQRGVFRQQLRNGWLILQYLCGVSPEMLARRYTCPEK
jgi:rSAM/selenodomain-associated transferase 2